ncbi:TRIGALACTOSYLDIACYLGLYCEROL 4, chloroplastic [Olea europaea subsp. europaea]|nr:TRIGALACTOSYLDIACYLGLYCEROL 4, chloroplastic [Olea europaea subsp. europaea]
MDNLKNMGFPVDGLAFDPELVIRGLVIDKEKGNLVKADRFGYIKRAMHGTRMLSTREVSEMYGRELVDLRKESRWEFLNTLFSVSEAVAYMQWCSGAGIVLQRKRIMKKLRWVMDGEFWDVDVSTPVTLDGVARPVPVDPLHLGISRGPRFSRPKQIDFFQRFMFMPLVPSFSHYGDVGLSLQRVFSLYRETWFMTLLGQFNVQKFVTSLRTKGFRQESDSSWLQNIRRHLSDQSFYGLNFCSELLLTPDDVLTLSLETHGDQNTPRKKAVFHHKFPLHNLTVEAASPALFVDQNGNYWDVPFSVSMDLAPIASDSGTSCRFCINHTTGNPKPYEGQPTSRIPATILPGLCTKCAVSCKKNVDIWRSEAPKMKMVQPYDIFLSSPHISASGILGAVITASIGENSIRAQVEDGSLNSKGFGLRARGANSAILADLFASASLSAQHGNFQRRFLDLTQFYARLDIPSGSKFLSGATRLACDLYNSETPTMQAVQAICPTASLSFQQQIAGPFSFRIDSGVTIDLKKDLYLSVKDPIFAVEYALQVLGSAKAIAWYAPKQREFMIELRFFET